MHDDPSIGRNIARLRRRRHLTQATLGDLVGVSGQYISLLENGSRPVSSRTLVHQLAAALDVSVATLVGQPYDPTDPELDGFAAAVPRIEQALMGGGAWEAGARPDPLPLPALVADSRHVLALRMDARFAALGALLPPLIADLYVHTAGGGEQEQRQAWAALGRAAFAAALAVKGQGYASTAWVAAQVVAEAAAATDDRVTAAAAEFARAQVLLAVGATRRSLNHSAGALGRLQLAPYGPEAELAGMLHLQAALTQAALGDGDAVRGHYAEAVATAGRTGEGQAFALSFGPTNAGVWGMSIAVEQQQPDRVPGIAAGVDQSRLSTADRLSRFFVELGRAHHMAGDDGQALAAMLRAENAAPSTVRSRPVVREVVGHMLRRERRMLTSSPLGQLANRVGAVPA